MTPQAVNGEALPASDVWREMRLHMEWNEGLSLCFLFADDSATLAPLAQWADDTWQWRTAPLLKVEPAHAAQASVEVLQALQDHLARLHMTRAPVWVQMLAQDPTGQTQWDAARASLLARLNEGREWLVRDFARPLVLCFPLSWRHRAAQIAPDLWHVRSYTAALQASLPNAPTPDTVIARPSNPQAYTEAALLPVQNALTQARTRFAAQPKVLNLKRELSIALDDLGQVFLDNGDERAALEAYRESLGLSRQLQAALGDSPQVLDDLAVSLERLGRADKMDAPQRLDAVREAVLLRERLVAAMPDSDFYAQRLTTARNILAEVQPATGLKP